MMLTALNDQVNQIMIENEDFFLFLSSSSSSIRLFQEIAGPRRKHGNKHMYPTIDEPDTYSEYSHPGYAVPNYGTPHVYSAPPTIMRHSVTTPQWSSDLFHCVDDPSLFLVTCLCPCFTFGRIAEIVDKGTPSCGSSGLCYGLLAPTGLACLYSCNYRSRMRAQYDLPEAPCMDCFVHFCCEACALCQEYRQLKHYGLDLSLGWEGNMERTRRLAVTVAPAVPPGMMR